MFLGKDGAVVTVGLHTKILSPGLSRPLLRSPIFVVDTLVTGAGVPDAVARGSMTEDPAETR